MLEPVSKPLLIQSLSMGNLLFGLGLLGVLEKVTCIPLSFYSGTQNLTTILYKARFIGLIPGFSTYLTNNFNHLMYADDLILVSTASRKSARNICLCLNIYTHLSGQYPNHNKSEIYFPNCFNKRVSPRICNILNFKQGKTPFTYLGVLISPKRLGNSHFDSMINRINMAVAEWGKAILSKASKSVFINRILMGTPIYCLSVYPIPDIILSKLSRLLGNFFGPIMIMEMVYPW